MSWLGVLSNHIRWLRIFKRMYVLAYVPAERRVGWVWLRLLPVSCVVNVTYVSPYIGSEFLVYYVVRLLVLCA